MSATLPGGSTRVEVRHVRRTLGLGALVWIMFFAVSGGPYGLEDTIGESGAGMGLLLIPAGGTERWGGRPRPPTLAVSEDSVGDLRRSQQQLLELVVHLEQCERSPCHLE